ncbi:MAG: S8 family serine peptidase [Deltaproteobacteria bacterium]
MLRHQLLPLVLAGLLAACAGARPVPGPAPASDATARQARPNMDPGTLAKPPAALADSAPPPPAKPRVVAPEVAYARGWMPLASTGADTFRTLHPAADGRGVLIAILDTGIDPSAPGLGTTSTGERKILDLRDFSGEGAVALTRVAPRGDTVEVAGRRLAGFGRVVALNARGPYYGGALAEIPLGGAPAADLNGNGTVGDTLPVVVVKATDGWVLFADTDGDRSLANEKPVHDFLQGYETFGWASRGRPAPVALAANFADSAGAPTLDLFVDTGNHGTFVSGVAAGHDLYGVAGFDGVAPGAQLIGLKIANNAQGGISVTGSMLRAMDYAIRFAGRRRIPLVMNMSFGVGNEVEGAAVIDRLVDSVLAAHPDVVFTVSAGNDGPGLSTIGFPGSAERVLTAGATLPGAFLRRGSGAAPPDQIASFSARGGELAKPDVIAPGFAYSSVPRYDVGGEVKQGTSFSSPHMAGVVALLRSALLQAGMTADAHTIKQALMVTARPQGDLPFIDEGAGLPEVESAWRWLEQRRTAPDVAVRAVGHGDDAAFRGQGLASPGDTVQAFEITHPGATGTTTYTLRSDAPWLMAPRSATITGDRGTVRLRYKAAALQAPGLYTGVVSGWTTDTLLGPAFRLVNTIAVPQPAASADLLGNARLEPGGTRRAFFAADSGRPFVVRVSTAGAGEGAFAALYEPGGQPFRDGSQQQAGADSAAAVFHVDGRDAVAGVYEADAIGVPVAAATVSARVEQSPFRLRGSGDGRDAVTDVANVSGKPATGEVGVVLAGGERSEPVAASGSGVVRVPFTAPAWAKGVVVDLTMDPAQWERFTDFGLSVFDAAGRIVAKEPLNYALGRLSTTLPETHGDLPLEVRLFPGFADPAVAGAWKAEVVIRLYASDPLALSAGADRTAEVSLAAGQAKTIRFRLPDTSPWALPSGFGLLGAVVAYSGGDVWTSETSFGLPGPR